MSAIKIERPFKQYDLTLWTGALLQGNGTPIDCTGATVVMYVKNSDGTARFTGAITMVGSPTLGRWSYQPIASDVATAGIIRIEFHLHVVPHRTIPNDGYYQLEIQPSLGPS